MSMGSSDTKKVEVELWAEKGGQPARNLAFYEVGPGLFDRGSPSVSTQPFFKIVLKNLLPLQQLSCGVFFSFPHEIMSIPILPALFA